MIFSFSIASAITSRGGGGSAMAAQPAVGSKSGGEKDMRLLPVRSRSLSSNRYNLIT